MALDLFNFDGVLDEFKRKMVLNYSGGSVLDVGCNDGQLVNYLNSLGRKSSGIDNDKKLIAKAEKQFPHIDFREASMESIPFPDNSFETCVAWNTLEHVDDEEKAIKELLRVASKNIILVVPRENEISIPSGITYRHYIDPTHKRYYTKERLEQLFGYNISHLELVSRCQPLLAYSHIGIPLILCRVLDKLFWAFARNKDPFLSVYFLVVEKIL